MVQRRLLPALAVGVAVGLAACGSGDEVGRVVAVPRDVPTIAEAVAQARRGTIIEIAPGVYHEAVSVEVPGITLRGLDRNEVVLDGRFTLANGISVKANDVAVENFEELRRIVAAFDVGDTIQISVERSGLPQPLKLKVELMQHAQ